LIVSHSQKLPVPLEPNPEQMRALGEDVLDYIGHAAAKAADPAGPGYLAFIPGGGLYTAALADFITAAVNRYTTVFLSSTTIRGRHTLRIAILSHRTHLDRVDEAVDLLEKAARQ